MIISGSSVRSSSFFAFSNYRSIISGRNTNNLTVGKELFLTNRHIQYWRLEVVYSFPTGMSSSSLDIILNKPPKNGSCSIDPLNGTATTTPFRISCLNWFDEDGIKDYSLYSKQRLVFSLKNIRFLIGYDDDYSLRKIIGFSFISQFDVRLSVENENISKINLIVEIRDRFDCITETNISSVTIQTDSSSLSQLINTFEDSSALLSDNSLVQLLSSGNQNTVGQILTSVSQQLNQINNKALEKAISSKSSSMIRCLII